MEIKKHKKNKWNKNDSLSWLIAVPSLILFGFFIWGPLVQNIIYSFYKTNNFDMVAFNGVKNYIEVFKSPLFSQALVNTVLYVIYSLIIGFIIPIILALIISEITKGKSIFKVGFYIPNIVPAIAVILMWKVMMDANDYGFFNIILHKLGLQKSAWISNEKLSIPLIILTLTWKSAGSTMLIYLATLQSVDNSLYEAARIRGLSTWQRMRYITLPALLSNIKLLLIIQIISIFQIFYEPMVFMGQTNNNANTLGLLIYKYIYTEQNSGQAAALGVITMLILLGFTFVYLYFDKRTETNAIKIKPYISYDEIMFKKENRKESKIKAFYNKTTKNIKVFFKKVKNLKPLTYIKEKLGVFFSKTFKFTKRIFKNKTTGIVAYSDYKKPTKRINYYLMFIIITLGLIVVLLPFAWLFFSSFKTSSEILQSPNDFSFFPAQMEFSKYLTVISSTKIMRNVLNSFIIAMGAMVCSVLFNGLLAYVVSVLKPKGHKVIHYLILGSMLIPAAVALVPLYININGVYEFIAKISGMSLRKVQSTFTALIPFWLIAGASPFNFLLFKAHFDSLPKELFEVASLEGASKIQTFFKIIVPLSIPTIVVVSIFTITASWNDFLLPYIIINNEAYWPVMVKLFRVNAEMFSYGITLDQFLALLLFTMLPPVLIYFVFQRQITSNVATTGIK